MKKENSTTERTTTKTRPRTLSGVVLSSNMKDTIVVAVTRYVKHPKYKKYIKQVKRYKVHDEGNTCKEGDTVRILDGKPISKEKSYRVTM